MDAEFTRDMGYSRKDFLRVLPKAIRDYEHVSQDDKEIITHPDKSGTLTIIVSSLPNRVLGFIVIERSEVKFVFEGYTLEERKEFMFYFDRGYRRGGG